MNGDLYLDYCNKKMVLVWPTLQLNIIDTVIKRVSSVKKNKYSVLSFV